MTRTSVLLLKYIQITRKNNVNFNILEISKYSYIKIILLRILFIEIFLNYTHLINVNHMQHIADYFINLFENNHNGEHRKI